MISKENIGIHSIEQFKKWFQSFNSHKYKICDRIAKSHIQLCKSILTNKKWGNAEEENNIAYMTGVLFKGLIEFVQLAELTRGGKWQLDGKRTEKIWGLMWNCIDRFSFCSSTFISEEFDWIKGRIQGLHDDFINHFGYGLYSSPEILIQQEICSICNQDTRACSHLSGKLYNGVMCRSVPQKIQLRSVSLVTVPKDPRCRIWPWNMKEERTFETAILVIFRIDDWLNNVRRKRIK